MNQGRAFTYLNLLALWSLSIISIWLVLLVIPFALHTFHAIALLMFPPVLFLLATWVTLVLVREVSPSSS